MFLEAYSALFVQGHVQIGPAESKSHSIVSVDLKDLSKFAKSVELCLTLSAMVVDP